MVKGLILFPLKADDAPDRITGPCVDRLTMEPDYRIFKQLIDLSGQTPPGQDAITEKPTATTYWLPSPGCVDLLLESGITRRSIDRYGRPLTFIRTREFRRLKIPDDASKQNRAIAAAICGMPESTMTILYWR